MSTRTENILTILIGIAFLAPLYINATMNALDDSYQPGIMQFKEPFYYAYFVLMLIMLFFLFASIYKRIKYKQTYPLAKKASLSVIFTSIVIWSLGFAPCFYGQRELHTLQTVVLQSLLCPSYSSRTYVGLIITISLSGLIYLISRGKRNVNSQ